MIPLTRYIHFNYLFKGVLNELDLYHVLNGYELNDISQDIDDDAGVVHGSGAYPARFHQISEKDLFITSEDFSKLYELLENPSSEKQTVQQKREVIFAQWIDENQNKDIPSMKRADVWAELQKVDHALFSVEFKNFFRDQKLIPSFKHGRK